MKKTPLNWFSVTFLLIAFILASSVSVVSQTHIAKTVTINSNCKGFYEYLPENYNSSDNKFPLIIYCSGAGSLGNGSATDLRKLISEGIPYYINNGILPKSFSINGSAQSFIIISPQFVNWPSPSDITAVINYFTSNNYRVDQSRIYLVGYSAGGNVAWKYPNSGLTFSNRIAATIPVAGFNSPYIDSGAKYIAASNLPVWALHAESDERAPISWSQNFVNKINSYNPAIKAKITRISGINHEQTKLHVFNPTYKPDGKSIYEWLLSYSRNHIPDAVSENDKSLILPVDSTDLNGSLSFDLEGDAIIYSWRKLYGPSRYLLFDSSKPIAKVKNLIAGLYSFILRASDLTGRYDEDTLNLNIINPFPNVAPSSNAGKDTTILYPVSNFFLDAQLSIDSNGTIEKYLWRQISGPVNLLIATSNQKRTSVSDFKPGNYSFELSVTDNENAIGVDTINISVLNYNPNIIPNSRVGSDINITVNTDSVFLNGSTSNDPDGWIVKYSWKQIGGSNLTLTNSNSSGIWIKNFVIGSYAFELTVTDNLNSVGRDTIIVNVNAEPTFEKKYIKINLYGGVNPYLLNGWNNWNVAGKDISNSLSGNLKYDNDVLSLVNATLSWTQGIFDNGSTYGGIMCPPEVLRYGSYATSTTRNLILNGLNDSLTYDLELFASRNITGNSTIFIINGISKSIITDNNKTNKVVFTSIRPLNKRITIAINKSGTFTYLNGVVITEISNTSQNFVPLAKAGNNFTVTLPIDSATLDGSASYDSDGNIIEYLWKKISGPAGLIVDNPNNSVTKIRNLVYGNYIFELAVKDNQGIIAKDTVSLQVQNSIQAPPNYDTINCNKNFKIVVLGSSTAYGTGASPIDSSWVNKYTRYLKLKNISNSVINLATLSLTTYQVLNPTGFIPPIGRQIPDTNRNITKALSLKPDLLIINMPSNDIANGISLDEQKSNYERAMHLADSVNIPVWVTTSQPRTNLNAGEKDQLKLLRDWTYLRFKEKAIDFWTDLANEDGSINSIYNAGDNIHLNNDGHQILYSRVITESILDTMCLRSGNRYPIANAGKDTTVFLPSTLTNLNAALSSDPDGIIVFTRWRKLSGPSAYVIADSLASSTSVTNLALGIYSFELLVRDDKGAESRDTIAVIISTIPLNSVPIAKAGPDASIVLPSNTITLNGTSSFDSDGFIVSSLWKQISGENSALIQFSNQLQTNVSFSATGVYEFELTVTDNSGGVAKDSILISVLPKVNIKPEANAGVDISIILPIDSILLDASKSVDSDGSLISFSWRQISGPNSSVIENNISIVTSVDQLIPGSYLFELLVTDNELSIDFDTIQVIVNQTPSIITKALKVNIFGGLNPYNLFGWNNWNLSGVDLVNRSSGLLKYEDNSISTIQGTLSWSQGIIDNGVSYGGSMCPPEVLRYGSYATAVTRSLTLSGLNNSAKYDIEFFASRSNTGNSTRFEIGGQSKTIVTDNNKNTSVLFTGLSPVSGQLTTNIIKTATFTYINGFVLREYNQINQAYSNTNVFINEHALMDSENLTQIQVFPNPVEKSTLKIKNINNLNGQISIRIIDQFGRIHKEEERNINPGISVFEVDVVKLPPGLYSLRLFVKGKLLQTRFIKL